MNISDVYFQVFTKEYRFILNVSLDSEDDLELFEILDIKDYLTGEPVEGELLERLTEMFHYCYETSQTTNIRSDIYAGME